MKIPKKQKTHKCRKVFKSNDSQSKLTEWAWVSMNILGHYNMCLNYLRANACPLCVRVRHY